MSDMLHEQSPDWSPDRVSVWLLSTVGAGFGGTLLFTWVGNSLVSGIAAAAVVFASLATLPRGYWHRSRFGGTQAGFIGAVAALIVYIALAVYITASGSGLGVQITQVSCFWLAATLLAWQSLRVQVPFDAAAYISALLLVGPACLLFGVGALRAGDTVTGVLYLVTAPAALLFGVGALRADDTLLGVACLLAVPGALLGAAGGFRADNTLMGVAFLLVGFAFLLAGVSELRHRATLVEVAVLLGGVAFLLAGVSNLRADDMLYGVSFLLVAVSFLLVGLTIPMLRSPSLTWLEVDLPSGQRWDGRASGVDDSATR